MTTDPLVRRFNPAGPNYGPRLSNFSATDPNAWHGARSLSEWVESGCPNLTELFRNFGHSPSAAVSLGGAAAHISEP